MIIGHGADFHVGVGHAGKTETSRLDDAVKCMDFTSDKLIENGVECFVFAGDAFRAADINISKATPEIMAFSAFLRKLSNAGIQVVAISGTPSHDSTDAYKLIKAMEIPGVHIFTEPGMITVKDTTFCCLPGLNRNAIMTNEQFQQMSAHEVHSYMTDQLTAVCRGMRAQSASAKTILIAHMTYAAADTGFTDLIQQNEPVLSGEAAALFDAVYLGHIHRPQRCDNVFYSGSIERYSFNDEGVETGFWIHDERKSHFVATPSKVFETFEINQLDAAQIVAGEITLPVHDKYVRLRVKCSADDAKLVQRRALPLRMYDAGAAYVNPVELIIEDRETVRDVGKLAEGLGVEEATREWAIKQGYSDDDAMALASAARRLMEGAK